MTTRTDCPTCNLLKHLGELFAWDAQGAVLWDQWDDDDSDPPGSDEHWGLRPTWSDYRIESDLLDSKEFVRAAQMLTCSLHPGTPLHVPGKLNDGTIGPACGAAPSGAAVSGLIYALSADPVVLNREAAGVVREAHAMHPHVTCVQCGDALTEWHTARYMRLESTQRWQSWLQGGRREPLATGCSISVPMNSPGVLAFPQG